MIGILVRTNNTYQVLDADVLKVLDCFIEIVRPRAAYEENLLKLSNVFICDEEGLMKDLEVNKTGTILYNGLKSAELYPIVGNIFIIGEKRDSFGDLDFRDLTSKEIDFYKKLLKKFGIQESNKDKE